MGQNNNCSILNEKEPYQFIAIRNDISSRKEAEHRLRLSESRYRELAYHDALTSLPNRLQLITTVNELIADKKFGMIYFDLDRFKLVNDTLGHMIGDLLLSEVASRLHYVLGEKDVLARLGGDEFVLLTKIIDKMI